MRELRTVLVMVSPLLAGLIRYIVESRIQQPHARLSVIAAIDDLEQWPPELGGRHPDLVILGPSSNAEQRAAPWAGTDARVLMLSDNLSRVSGPDPRDIDPLTLDTLTQRLSDILRET